MPTFTPMLPPELWLQIFRYATASPRPPPRRTTVDITIDFKYQIKCSLVLVCKRWRALAIQFLYESVQIRQAHWARIQLVLVNYGRWVRQLYLPSASASTVTIAGATDNVRFIDIVNRCPYIETLIKPRGCSDGDFHFWHGLIPSESVPMDTGRHFSTGVFASLQCLHWFCNDRLDIDGMILREIVLHAPNLSSLSISHFKKPLTCMSHPSRSNASLLSSLKELEFQSSYTDAMPFVIEEVDMRNLMHVITLTRALTFDQASFLLLFGQQLQVVDLIPDDARTTTTGDDVRMILQHCPRLRKFKYTLETTVLPFANGELHSSLSSITLRTYLNGDSRVLWCLQMHLPAFTGKAFPALRRVVLEGNWSWVLFHQHLRHQFYRSLHARGCSLEYDGRLVSLDYPSSFPGMVAV